MNKEKPNPPRFAADFRAEMARREISGTELARRLGVPRWWVSKRLTGHIPVRVEDLERMAAAVDVPPHLFVVDLRETADAA